MIERANLYRVIHKGVRVALSRLSAEAGRTDFGEPVELARLRQMAVATFQLLDEHASVEDRFVVPLLVRAAPEVAAKIDADHRSMEEMAKVLWRMFDVVAQAGAAAPREGHALVLQLSRYQATQLSHMADEEELAMAALWRAFGDDTLLRVHGEIAASVSPEVMAGMLALVLPSANARERAELIRGIQGPPAVFERVLRIAEESLEAGDFARLEHDLRPRAA